MKTSGLRKKVSKENYSQKFSKNYDDAFKSLYDKGEWYGRHKGKKDKKNLNYVPQSKHPKWQDERDESYLKRKRKLDYSPQSKKKKDIPTIILNQGK